jgi:hypothetical protein
MIRTAEAVIDEHAIVRLLEPVEVTGVRRALVTILDEEPNSLTHETAILSERSLAEDWNRPEEDAAWSSQKLENSTSKRWIE